MKLIIFIITSLIISSCNFQQTLINDELVAENFSAEEIIELEKLHDLVFDQICPNSERNKSYSDCYNSWAKNTGKYIGKQASNNPDYYDIPELPNDKSVDFIHSLDSNIIKLIWRTAYTIPAIWKEDSNGNWISSDQDSIFYITVDTNSKFFELIKSQAAKTSELALLFDKSNSGIINYYNAHNNGGINQIEDWRLFVQILNYPENFDLEDPKIRLLIAVNLVTMQYQFHKKR